MSAAEKLTAYRKLFKTALRAVRYSVPAKYQVRDILRQSFRNEPSTAFEPVRIANTLEFLDRADKYKGLEHKILKNIVKIRWARSRYPYNSRLLKDQTELASDVRRTMWSHFDATLAMLNETQHLCLRP